VSIEVLRSKIWGRYAHINKSTKNSKKKDKHALKAIMQYDDVALGAFLVKKFKGSCNKCGKYGHKSVDCQDKPTNNTMKGTGDIAEGNAHKFHGKTTRKKSVTSMQQRWLQTIWMSNKTAKKEQRRRKRTTTRWVSWRKIENMEKINVVSDSDYWTHANLSCYSSHYKRSIHNLIQKMSTLVEHPVIRYITSRAYTILFKR